MVRQVNEAILDTIPSSVYKIKSYDNVVTKSKGQQGGKDEARILERLEESRI